MMLEREREREKKKKNTTSWLRSHIVFSYLTLSSLIFSFFFSKKNFNNISGEFSAANKKINFFFKKIISYLVAENDVNSFVVVDFRCKKSPTKFKAFFFILKFDKIFTVI